MSRQRQDGNRRSDDGKPKEIYTYIHHLEGGKVMSKDERKEVTERIAEKFALLPEHEKSFIAGYMARVEEEYLRTGKATGATA